MTDQLATLPPNTAPLDLSGNAEALPHQSLQLFAVMVTGGQFQWMPHLIPLREHFQAIADGKSEHETTLILAPPRSGKSWLGCQIFPAYYMWRHPDRKVIIGAHTASLAWRHSLMAQAYYTSMPSSRTSLRKGAKAGGWWQTNQGGQVFAIGRDSWVLGQGYDVLLVDDPFRREALALTAREQEEAFAWWQELGRREEVAWRQQTPPRRILLQQRITRYDLAGLILEEEEKRARGMTVYFQPALETDSGRDVDGKLAPEFPTSCDVLPRVHVEVGQSTMPRLRSTADLLERRRDDPVRFDAVYQQNPRPEGSDLWFRREEFMQWPAWVTWPPEPEHFIVERRIRSWDLAFTPGAGDWTAGVRMWKLTIRNDSPISEKFRAQFPLADRLWMLVVDDVVRRRVAPAVLDDLILNTARSDREWVEISIPIDPAGGIKIASDLRRLIKRFICTDRGYERSPRTHLIRQTRAKGDRAWRYKTLVNRGQVFVIDAPWTGGYLSELAEFTGESWDKGIMHDDQVDASSDATNTIALPRRNLLRFPKRSA